MSKKLIDLNLSNPAIPVLVEGQSTLSDAYVCSVLADSAMQKVRGAQSGVFGILRHKVCQLFAAELAKVGGEQDKMNLEHIVQDFLLECQQAEDQYDSPSDKELSRTWVNAKSQLKSALEKGYDFYSNKEVGQSALQKWSRDQRMAEEEAAKAAAIKAAAERKGSNVSVLETHNKSVQIENAQDSKPSISPEGDTLPDEVSELMSQLQSLVYDLAKADPLKAANILKGAVTQMDAASKKALAKLAS